MVVRLRVVRRIRRRRRSLFDVDAARRGACASARMGGRRMIATETKTDTVSWYINGKRETPADRAFHPVTNPATGAVVAKVPFAVEADVDRAGRSAHDACLKWREV